MTAPSSRVPLALAARALARVYTGANPSLAQAQ